MAGRGLNVAFSVQNQAFQWLGYASRENLASEIELLCACLHRPGWRQEPRLWRPDQLDQSWLTRVNRSKSLPLIWLKSLISGSDPRFEPDQAGFMKTDSNQVASWLGPLLETARVKVTISGDFSPAAALQALAGTFGALPARAPWQAACPYPVLPVALQGIQDIKARGQGETACVIALPLPCPANATAEAQQNLLAALLHLRLRKVMRSELGFSYGPSARISRFLDSPWLLLSVPCANRKIPDIGGTLRQLLTEFKDNGWSKDEFRRAARPWAATAKNNARDPEWWLEALDHPEWIPPSTLHDDQQLLLQESGTRTLARQLALETALELRIALE